MVSLNQNRPRYCKSQLGGVKNTFLAPYRSYDTSQVDYDGVTLLSFPTTYVYRFELVPGSVFNQQQQENEGGKYFEQSITLTFSKITVFDNIQFQKMLFKDFFLIVEDYNGNFFLMGFKNGIYADKLEVRSPQYKIDFSGQEQDMAPYVTDLMGSSFIVVDGHDYIFQDETNYIFQDDTNYIFQS